MRVVNLSTELLRTFVTVIEVESFTRAAEILGRTQPAISLQIKRLEDTVGYALIKREGKDISLTERGESLAIHARQILRLNDLAVAQFEHQKESSKLRVGLPVDYAVNTLQSCLTNVVRQFSDIQIEIRCDLSKNLLSALRSNEIDIAVALFDGDDQQFLFRNWKEQPVWVGATDFEVPDQDVIPLVVHPFGCVYRERMATALKLAGQDWRIAYSSPGIGGVQHAVRDGLGLSCLTGPTVLDGMRRFTEKDGLPALPALHIGLFARQAQLGAGGYAAIDAIVNTLESQSSDVNSG
ncbi:LysR family transcriptional regulator [Roseovarius faecimaris]|uniref:LysR family transcriptional regulator n=1 Tax=Roseovarius faecimaris TaxID=2494550 RepID=A0A6I6J1Z7_9RHOB|nr:LysR family transcriptional regulator [Roseovarius faecimaris]QGX98778.1 LysR family transcriptional regulator [Roseovarius faecimaris]